MGSSPKHLRNRQRFLLSMQGQLLTIATGWEKNYRSMLLLIRTGIKYLVEVSGKSARVVPNLLVSVAVNEPQERQALLGLE